MRFQYTEKKVTLPENVHKYAEKKVMKLERFFGTDADALVTFRRPSNARSARTRPAWPGACGRTRSSVLRTRPRLLRMSRKRAPSSS